MQEMVGDDLPTDCKWSASSESLGMITCQRYLLASPS